MLQTVTIDMDCSQDTDAEANANSSSGWTTETELVRTHDRPTNLTDAIMSAVAEAIQRWPELSETPPLYQFVDVDKLDGLFRTGATDDSESLPSVEFQFQSCWVTLLCGSSVRVIIDRYP
jgi:hypothetical protein